MAIDVRLGLVTKVGFVDIWTYAGYIYNYNIYIQYIDTYYILIYLLYKEINSYELAFNKKSATMLLTTVPLPGPICTTTKSGS